MPGWKLLTNGILRENPVLVLLIGICPSLAVTTAASNSIGMGMATTFVLVGSNIVISCLRRIIPHSVRIPCYIVIIAGFVTMVGFLLERYLPELNQALGIYVALIIVNCIILMRAETFASHNGIVASVLDGLGTGIGFTLALLLIGSFREILGAGSWFGIPIIPESVPSMEIFISPAGGFFVLGIVIAVVNAATGKRRKNSKLSCDRCHLCQEGSPEPKGGE